VPKDIAAFAGVFELVMAILLIHYSTTILLIRYYYCMIKYGTLLALAEFEVNYVQRYVLSMEIARSHDEISEKMNM
jgi:hypothetical protein